MLHRFSIVFLASCLLFTLVPSCKTAPGSSTDYGNRVGNLAPDFILNDLGGSTVTLSSFIGRPVVVHFWETT
jgi:hypothetical protein